MRFRKHLSCIDLESNDVDMVPKASGPSSREKLIQYLEKRKSFQS